MRKALLFLVLVPRRVGRPAAKRRRRCAPGHGARPAAAPVAAPLAAAAAAAPMPVEFAVVKRAPVVRADLSRRQPDRRGDRAGRPRVNGRLATVNVQLGDSVRRGQTVAKVEDMEIQEQVRQAEAAFKVAQATIRQRDADLKLATTNKDRSKSLYDRQLLPQQTYDDTVARYEAAQAQNDLANAQFDQAKARLEELKITLQNTIITSPVDGFVSKRFSDQGAFVGPQLSGGVGGGHPHRTDGGEPGREGFEARARRHAAAVEVDAFRVKNSRPRQPGRPGVRSGHAHRGDGNRDPQRQLPAQARHVCAGAADVVDSRPNALTVPRNALVELDGKPACSSRLRRRSRRRQRSRA
jgi:multidrug efflux pump subunit AcrA (membrane-fusion protein)